MVVNNKAGQVHGHCLPIERWMKKTDGGRRMNMVRKTKRGLKKNEIMKTGMERGKKVKAIYRGSRTK